MCREAEMPEDRTHWPELGLGAPDPGVDPTSQLMGVLRAHLKPEGALGLPEDPQSESVPCCLMPSTMSASTTDVSTVGLGGKLPLIPCLLLPPSFCLLAPSGCKGPKG